MEYLIGDVVDWKVGNIICKGIIREDFEKEVEVICVEVNGRPTKSKLKIQKSCIIKE